MRAKMLYKKIDLMLCSNKVDYIMYKHRSFVIHSAGYTIYMLRNMVHNSPSDCYGYKQSIVFEDY